MTTDAQFTLGSLSSTRSTVARPARTPNTSSAACGVPVGGTSVQSGGTGGRSSGLAWLTLACFGVVRLLGGCDIVPVVDQPVVGGGDPGAAGGVVAQHHDGTALPETERRRGRGSRQLGEYRRGVTAGRDGLQLRLCRRRDRVAEGSVAEGSVADGSHAPNRQSPFTAGATGTPSACTTVVTAPFSRSTSTRPPVVAISTPAAAGPLCCSTAPGSAGSTNRRSPTRSDESARSSTTGVSPTVVIWMSGAAAADDAPTVAPPRDSGPSAKGVLAGSAPGATRSTEVAPAAVATTVPCVDTATTGSAPTVATGVTSRASTDSTPSLRPTQSRPSDRSATARVPPHSCDGGVIGDRHPGAHGHRRRIKDLQFVLVLIGHQHHIGGLAHRVLHHLGTLPDRSGGIQLADARVDPADLILAGVDHPHRVVDRLRRHLGKSGLLPDDDQRGHPGDGAADGQRRSPAKTLGPGAEPAPGTRLCIHRPPSLASRCPAWPDSDTQSCIGPCLAHVRTSPAAPHSSLP